MICSLPSINTLWSGVAGFVFFVEHWLDSNLSLGGMIAIPAIITALLMPIAIFLMERQDKYEFDKSVIVDNVLLVKFLIPGIVLVSIMLIYHSSLLSIIFSTALLAVTGIALVRTYRWTKSYESTTDKITYRQRKRLDYLGSLKTDNDKLEVWTLILNDEELSEKNQQGLITRYLATVNGMKDKDGAYPRTNMHLLLIRNLSKINFSNRESYDELLVYALGYFEQYQEWEGFRRDAKNKKISKDVARPKHPEYYLEEIFVQFLRLSLGDRDSGDVLDHLFFSQIKKYTERKEVNVPIFANHFLSVYIHFLELNEKSDIGKLWDFMSDWTVTRENIENSSTEKLSLDLLQAYVDGILPKALGKVELFSREAKLIDTVTEKLLPNINPILWFDVVTFYTNGWGQNEGEDSLHAQIRNHIERGRNFGLVTTSGLMGWNGEDRKESPEERQSAIWKAQDDETIFMLRIIFRWLRNPDEIQKVIHMTNLMLNEESIITDELHEKRLRGLHDNFQKILAFTDAKIQKQNQEKKK